MKKIAVVLALMVLSLAMFVPFTVYTQSAQAQTTGYSIQTVTHEVRVLYSGQVVISDTIQIAGTMPNTIQVGFPFQYGSYVIEAQAYDSDKNELTVTTGVPLQGQSGFYGATIQVSEATSSTFTVIFVLSNDLLSVASTQNGFVLNYPAYPSFTVSAATVNANLVFPSGGTIKEIAKEDGNLNVSSYTKTDLPAFTSMPANATFLSVTDYLEVVSIKSLDRSITVSPSGIVTCTDKYTLFNDGAENLIFYKFDVPLAATGIAARDQFGRALGVTYYTTASLTQVVNVTFVQALSVGSLIEILVDYNLPSITSDAGKFVLNADLYSYYNYYVESLSSTITPPEGATLVSPASTQIISRNAFQESLTVNRAGITYTDTIYNQEKLQVTFNYNPLWIAFRPTIWMWAIAAVGAAIVAFMLRPKAKTTSVKISAPVAAAVGVSADQIRSFVDAYEERTQVNAELNSLEARVQRGRIPRRKYKERRALIEGRIVSLRKTITELKEILRSSGGSHADTIWQLETAETSLNEANQEMSNLEAQRNIGEISVEEYKKQLADIERRKNKAENTINGLMIRLRGEIR